MRGKIVRLFAISALLFAAAAVAQAQKMLPAQASAQAQPCSLHSLNASYGFRLEGTSITPFSGPFASVGVQTFDGNGNLTGTEYVSINGNAQPATYTGTYTVNADCTGVMTLVFPFFSGDIYFVIVDNGKELLAMPTTPPGGTVSGTFKKQ